MKRLILILLLFIFYIGSAFCQNDSIINPYAAADTLSKDFGLFTKDEILDLSLRFDINEYKKTKLEDVYLDAVLTYYIGNGDSINKNIKLKSRGIARRKICQFPPIILNFKKTEFSKDDLSRIEKLKLVTHCERGNEEYLFREYLVYKLYNILTDNSFKVRLVKIKYINTHDKSKPVSSYAFFIEPLEFLAQRTNSTKIEMLNLDQNNIQPDVMNRVALFNYMIGNTDWSVPGQHNCKILTMKKTDRPELGSLVPYDFDYAGLVNSRYAIPYEPLGLENVRQRYYQGTCRSEEVFLNALREFSEKKEAFYKTIKDFPLLSEKSKKDMINFLNSFYDGFEKKNILIPTILIQCKKM